MLSPLPSGVLSHLIVPVKIVNGIYRPCNGCHYYTACVVPKGAHLLNMNRGAISDVFKCEDYTPKMPIVG